MMLNSADYFELSPQQIIKRVRAKYPEAYALSVNEAIRVNRIDTLIWQFFDTHREFVSSEIPEGRTYPVYRNVYNDDSIALLRQVFALKRISLDNAYALAQRVLNKPWFEILNFAMLTDEDKKASAGLLTHEGYQGRLSADEWPEFYELWSVWDNQSEAEPIRKLLKLGDDYKFFCAGERDTLRLIIEIYEYNSLPFTVVQQEGYVSISSTPQSTALSSIGKRAIREAQADDFDEGFDMMAATGAHILLKGQQLTSSEWVNIDKLLRQINYKMYESGHKDKIVHITLDEFMSFRGLSDRKEARKQFAKAIHDLYEVSVEYGSGRDTLRVRYLQAEAHINNSKVAFILTDVFFDSLVRNSSIAMIPHSLFTLDGKSDNAYKIGMCIVDHKRRNINKPNENRVSVPKLLEVTSLPLASEIAPNRYKQQIIDRFFAALNKASSEGEFTYTLTHKGGEPLSQLEDYEAHFDYHTLIECVVCITWQREPEYYTALREQKAEEAQAQAAKKKRGGRKHG